MLSWRAVPMEVRSPMPAPHTPIRPRREGLVARRAWFLCLGAAALGACATGRGAARAENAENAENVEAQRAREPDAVAWSDDVAWPDAAAWRADLAEWTSRREARLASPDGYLALSGLFWIEPGRHSLGSDAGNDFVLPAGTPARFGVLEREDDVVTWHPADGDDGPGAAPILLLSDADEGGPTRLSAGTARCWVIRRGARLGLRVSDPASPVLAAYSGTERFAPDARFVVSARFVHEPVPRAVLVPTIHGDLVPDEIHGRLEFELLGRRCVLLPTGDPARGLSLLFADGTNDAATYAGGRFLTVPPLAADGRTTLDFNRAYNPPCVFTDFATCPLPPADNRLDLAVTAGEKRYARP